MSLDTATRSTLAVLVLLGSLALLPGGQLRANSFPGKPVVFVVPFSPGGRIDNVARIVARGLSEKLETPVMVDNRPGAFTSIGTEIVARSAPDGHTLLLTTSLLLLVDQGKISTVKSRVGDDLVPVGKLASSPVVMVVSVQSRIASAHDFVLFARARGRIGYGSLGQGSASHVAAELFKSKARIEIHQVPYRGAIQAYQDLISGQIPVVFDSFASALPLIKERQVRAIAVFQRGPFELARDIPSIDRSGVEGVYMEEWYGVFGPKGLRPEVLRVLEKGLEEALRLDHVQHELQAIGFQSKWEPSKSFENSLLIEMQHYRDALSGLPSLRR